MPPKTRLPRRLPATAAPRVRVVTTAGNFVIELDRNRAPLTVEAFLKYVNDGFYAGTIFHRVVAGFIAQAGGYTRRHGAEARHGEHRQ